MHMYITSALQKSDMKAVGLQLALDLLHEKVSNLKLFMGPTSTHTGFVVVFAGKTRSDNWIEDTHQRRTTELGQSL